MEASAQAKLEGQREGFLGWAEEVEHCTSKYHKVPEFEKLPSGELSLVYGGHCEGGVRAKALRCAALDGPWPKGVVDMLQTLDAGTGSVLMKGYDYLLSPDAEELDALGLRESMLFSKEIRGHGDDFIKNAMGGEKYLAAHCRRTDFLRVRTKTTPSADVIAGKLNVLMEETGIKQVFVATDAPTDLREDLQRQVKGTVRFYDGISGAVTFDHPGKQAAVEIWIAARADFFIGTIESRFTMWIQLERGFLGKARASSEQEFCKDYSKGPSQKCVAPHYRQPTRKGAHREAYQ
uniref:GDP-fucose protein O-fucosyltransferase 2 n=1 Tax=Alexandrium catenella TaxID=2925 RepID=A0A7S1QYH1_ALECA